MKTVVIDKSARRITIRRIEGVVNGRNDCEDGELPSVLLAKQARSAKRLCTVGKVSSPTKDPSLTNGVERKGKQIPFPRSDVTRSPADHGEVQSPTTSESADGNLSRKLTALERLKNLSFNTPQVRLQPLVAEQAHRPHRVPTEVPASARDRLLLESAHGRSKQSLYRRHDRDIHRTLPDSRKRDDAHYAPSSSEHSIGRSGGHRYDQQSYAKRARSPITEPWLPRGYNGYPMSRPHASCSNMDFSFFHPSADEAAIRERVFDWEKLPNLDFDESDLSACTRTELEVIAKFVLLRRASLRRSTRIMADEVSELHEAVETQKRWCNVLKCVHAYAPSSLASRGTQANTAGGKQVKTASSIIDREVNQAAAKLASSLARQAQGRTQALPSHDAQMNSLCNAFFNGMISAMLDRRINGKEEDSIA